MFLRFSLAVFFAAFVAAAFTVVTSEPEQVTPLAYCDGYGYCAYPLEVYEETTTQKQARAIFEEIKTRTANN